jgi:hypothetical protein
MTINLNGTTLSTSESCDQLNKLNFTHKVVFHGNLRNTVKRPFHGDNLRNTVKQIL